LSAERILRPLDGHLEIYHDVLADAVLAWRTRHEAEAALERQRAAAERRHRKTLLFLAAALVAVAAMAVVTVYALTQRAHARAAVRLRSGVCDRGARSVRSEARPPSLPSARTQHSSQPCRAAAAASTRSRRVSGSPSWTMAPDVRGPHEHHAPRLWAWRSRRTIERSSPWETMSPKRGPSVRNRTTCASSRAARARS